ncbi:hypothetical protein B0H19DRAFT_1060406 [Mycena capillaripes]|nr:hypothetical protein B0H19DRAFT_1060406 [Mycena capillaripes]
MQYLREWLPSDKNQSHRHDDVDEQWPESISSYTINLAQAKFDNLTQSFDLPFHLRRTLFASISTPPVCVILIPLTHPDRRAYSHWVRPPDPGNELFSALSEVDLIQGSIQYVLWACLDSQTLKASLATWDWKITDDRPNEALDAAQIRLLRQPWQVRLANFTHGTTMASSKIMCDRPELLYEISS